VPHAQAMLKQEKLWNIALHHATFECLTKIFKSYMTILYSFLNMETKVIFTDPLEECTQCIVIS
jgi:hypothetical protein